MKISDIVKEVGREIEMPDYKAKYFAMALFKRIEEKLKKGETVTIRGFGTFKMTTRKRIENLKVGLTGKTVNVPEKKVITFKQSTKVK